MRFGPWELIIILAIVLLIFGGRKIPDLARGLGEGIRNFRDSLKSSDKSADNSSEEKK